MEDDNMELEISNTKPPSSDIRLIPSDDDCEVYSRGMLDGLPVRKLKHLLSTRFGMNIDNDERELLDQHGTI